MDRDRLKLHITLYQMPDGMYLATSGEVPSCQILRGNKEHAFVDAKKHILKFLQERENEGRPFDIPEIREVEFVRPKPLHETE